MDPYLSRGGFNGYDPSLSATATTPSWKKWALGAGIGIVIALGVYMYMSRSNGGDGEGAKAIGGGGGKASAPATAASAGGGVASSIVVSEEPIATLEPDSKLASFAFESLTLPGYVPNAAASLARKPAGNPPYKLVQCGSAGYAIRWRGRYLTVTDPNKLSWTVDKQEQQSCFTLIPGYCGDKKHVLLRSKSNKMFVRADGASKALVCKDTPTARTSKNFCWKLQPEISGIQPCGCQYSYDLGKVVCTPCDVHTDPKPGASCNSVTPGYRASCCLQKMSYKGPKIQVIDSYCSNVVWPEVVGRSLNEAMLLLRTKRPDLTLRPCPEPCNAQAYPVPSPRTIVIPYDARSSTVTSPARLLL